jgi:hypothetical protein
MMEQSVLRMPSTAGLCAHRIQKHFKSSVSLAAETLSPQQCHRQLDSEIWLAGSIMIFPFLLTLAHARGSKKANRIAK